MRQNTRGERVRLSEYEKTLTVWVLTLPLSRMKRIESSGNMDGGLYYQQQIGIHQ